MDGVWGIGCLEYSSRTASGTVVGAKNKETEGWDTGPIDWEGSNLLGRCLMDVRRHLRG